MATVREELADVDSYAPIYTVEALCKKSKIIIA